MKKILVIWLSLSFLGFCTGNLCRAYADAKAEWEQLKAELQKGGFTPKELKGTERSSKEMLEHGATRDQLRSTFLDLKNKEVGGKDLKNTVDSMKDLIKAGETPREAGNVVSAAAHDAKAQGLKGKELAAKVHEAIRERKAQKDALKKAKKEGKETKRKWWEIGKKSATEEVAEEHKKDKSKSRGTAEEIEESEGTSGKGKGKGKGKGN